MHDNTQKERSSAFSLSICSCLGTPDKPEVSESCVDASISKRAGLLAKPRPPYHCLHRHRLHHWSGAAFSPPLFRPPFWRRAPCPIHPASPQAWARSRAPSLALRPPRFDRAEASRRCHTLPACLGAHTVANCWPPRLHQAASEGRSCGARTFAALSPMAPAPPHTTKQCTRAPPPALVRLVAAIVPRLQGTPCRGRLAPRFVLRLSKGPLGIGQGTPNRLWLTTFKVPLTSMWTG